MEMKKTRFMINGKILESDSEMADDECSDIDSKKRNRDKQPSQSPLASKITSPSTTTFTSSTNTTTQSTTIKKSNGNFYSTKKNDLTSINHTNSQGDIINVSHFKSKYSLNDRFFRKVIKKTREAKSTNSNLSTCTTKTLELIKTPSIIARKKSTTKSNGTLITYKYKQYQYTKPNHTTAK